MAWAADAQAVATAVFGPMRPKWIEMLPEAALAIILGMTNGLIRFGPAFRYVECAVFELVEAADAGAEDDAAAERVFLAEIEAAVLDRFDRTDHGELREPVESADVFGVHAEGRLGVEVLHFAGELDLEGGRVEQGDRRDAALAGEQPLPEAANVIANRLDVPQAGDDDATARHFFLISASM